MEEEKKGENIKNQAQPFQTIKAINIIVTKKKGDNTGEARINQSTKSYLKQCEFYEKDPPFPCTDTVRKTP